MVQSQPAARQLKDVLQFWAKSRQLDDGGLGRLSVAHHALNVAAVGYVLLGRLRTPIRLDSATLAALLALHDTGKFTRTFQAKVQTLWPDRLLGPYREPPTGYPHDATGYWLLDGPLSERLDLLFGESKPSARRPVLSAIAGHHGRPPSRCQPSERVACAACIAAASSFVDAVLALLQPPPVPAMRQDERAAFVWWLAGFTTLADWIGSAWRWFPPVPEGEQEALDVYWHGVALPAAARAVAEAGLSSAPVAAATGLATLISQRTRNDCRAT